MTFTFLPSEYEYVPSIRYTGNVDRDFEMEEPCSSSWPPSAYLHSDIFEIDLDFPEYHDHNDVLYSEESAVDVFDVKTDNKKADIDQYMPPNEDDGTNTDGGFCSC
jgi:hypothetical protein